MTATVTQMGVRTEGELISCLLHGIMSCADTFYHLVLYWCYGYVYRQESAKCFSEGG